MKKLLMLRGLPASGKTGYAVSLVAQGWKRVNKDDLRAMIDGGKWSKENEGAVKFIEFHIVSYYLENGFNVVVDDTNFAYEDAWREVAKAHGADFEIENFSTSVHECVRRDALRGDKSVGADVIWNMHRKYIESVKTVPYVKGLTDAYIFDLDGTLALMQGRHPFAFDEVGNDGVSEHVANILDALVKAGNKIIIVSGRDDSCMDITREWLLAHEIHFDDLIMRTTGDKRPDNIVKGEIYEQCIKGKYNILGVFDDRDKVVEFWRSLGLTCFQVNWGNF